MKTITRTMTIILIITTVLTALSAGLFYAYQCSVNPGLSKLADRDYLLAMQSINESILNPLFFASFMGTLVMLPLCAYLHYQHPRFTLLVAAALIYGFGTFGVTVGGNVPLNEKLASFKIEQASPQEIHQHRIQFETPWRRLHAIRTLAAVTALVMVVAACVKR